QRGAMNRFLIFIAASRTGMVHPIQNIAEPADRYLFSRCGAIQTQPLKRCLVEYGRLGFRSLRIKTDESWRPMEAHRLPICAFAMENANLFSVHTSSGAWTSQTSRCSLTRWLHS